MIISERIAELRKERGMTQEQLGLKVGVSSQAVSKWENGGAPDVELLPVIADVLGVSLDGLFGRDTGPATDVSHTVIQYLRSFPAERRMMELHRLLTASMPGLGIPDRLARELDGLVSVSETAWFAMEDQEEPSYWMRSLIADDSGTMMMVTAEDFPLFFLLPEPEGGYKQNLAPVEEYRKLFALLGEEHALEILLWMAHCKADTYISTAAVAKGCGCSVEETERLLAGMVDCGLLASLDIQTEDGTTKAWQQKNGEALVPFLYLARWLMQKKYLYFYGWNAREKPWLTGEKNV
ncbi:MAG: helix-turn-helix domain-containing protein [Lachnospiraceae bacterium]|nr:helix-turn-helix domain-containing protein [Lachnospiraceae bacterium]